MLRRTLPALAALAAPALALAADFPTFRAQEIDPHVGAVCYAVTSADVDGDGKPDVVALSEEAIAWFANPGWGKHVILKGATQRDNVCIQPRDIDGDGRVDFALGARWKPSDTQGAATLQWARRKGAGGGDDAWEVLPIDFQEPTIHRIRWGDVLGAGGGKAQLVVAPLQGRGTKGPRWDEGPGPRIVVYSVPADPTRPDWPMEVAEQGLHTVHNIQVLDFDGDGKDEIVAASWEGVFLLDRDDQGRWKKTQLGAGNRAAEPFKGSSEVKVGRLADGHRYIATIEPWHGFQVVVYTPPTEGEAAGLWERRVIDQPVTWGHGVWIANLDDDADEELIIGQRDPDKDDPDGPKGPGVYVFDPRPGAAPVEFTRYIIDDGGMACEDLIAVDLDADGRPEIVAGGRATHNVKIYWNQAP